MKHFSISGCFAAAAVLYTKLTGYCLRRSPLPCAWMQLQPKALNGQFFRHSQAKLICALWNCISVLKTGTTHSAEPLIPSTRIHGVTSHKTQSYCTTLHFMNSHRCTIQTCSQILNKILIIIRYWSRFSLVYNSETNFRIIYLCSKLSPYSKYTLF